MNIININYKSTLLTKVLSKLIYTRLTGEYK